MTEKIGRVDYIIPFLPWSLNLLNGSQVRQRREGRERESERQGERVLRRKEGTL